VQDINSKQSEPGVHKKLTLQAMNENSPNPKGSKRKNKGQLDNFGFSEAVNLQQTYG
jgi:hypothetical protein